MSEKLECPGCGAYTSDVLWKYEHAEPCPHCGLSFEAHAEIREVRRKHADKEVTQKYEEARKLADRLETELRQAEHRLNCIRSAVAGEFD